MQLFVRIEFTDDLDWYVSQGVTGAVAKAERLSSGDFELDRRTPVIRPPMSALMATCLISPYPPKVLLP